MGTSTTGKNDSIVVSALTARANFGRLLSRVDSERRSLVIEKRGTPRAILLSIHDYVKLAAPEPEVLRIIGRNRSATGRISWPRARSIKSSRNTGRKRRSGDASAPSGPRY